MDSIMIEKELIAAVDAVIMLMPHYISIFINASGDSTPLLPIVSIGFGA